MGGGMEGTYELVDLPQETESVFAGMQNFGNARSVARIGLIFPWNNIGST